MQVQIFLVPIVKERGAALIVLLILSSVTVIFPNIVAVLAAEDSWTTLIPMPTPRSAGLAVVDGKIYAIGGFNGSNYLNTTEMYDPKTDTWITKQPMPTARHSFAIATYENKIYVIGGIFRPNDFFTSGYTGVNEVYDPSTDTWETMEPMPTARSELQANVVGDKIYLIGGGKYSVIWPHGQSTDGLNEVYDPLTDSWSTKTPVHHSVSLYSSAVIDNKIYLILGTNFIYNTETDSWSFGKAIPTGAFGASMAAAGATTGVLAPKRIYVLGGNDGYNVALNFTQIYDPETDTWTNGTSMPTPRWALDVAVVNDELYAIGGRTLEHYLGTNEKYTPSDYIPEFPSWIILPLFLTITLVAIIVKKQAFPKQTPNTRE